jgi:NAD(P)-dependent dehydrogenase (short-subunit alcohol dehydrogenase family)
MANPQNKVILITGATSGIGLATARLLTRQAVQVVVVGHRQAALDAVAAELPSALAIRADMTEPDEVRAMIHTAHAELGRIDVLINNAGQGYEGPVADAQIERYAYLYRLNVLGPLMAMREVVPLMRQTGGGRIVNVCSPVATMTLPGLGLYASTKAALRTLTLTARAELARDGITLSLFYPFLTRSNFGQNAFHSEYPAALPFVDVMPDPDPPEFTAAKLIAAMNASGKEVSARPSWYFLYGMARKRLQRRPSPREM